MQILLRPVLSAGGRNLQEDAFVIKNKSRLKARVYSRRRPRADRFEDKTK